MAAYAVRIEEILKRTIIVPEAESIDEAIQKVADAINRNEIILDADDFNERNIKPSEYFKDGLVPENEDVSFYCTLK